MNDPQATHDELLSAYLDGELPEAQRHEVESRLAADPAYRQALDELRALSASMAALPEYRLPADFAQRVLRRAERQMLSSDGSGTAGAPKSPHTAAATATSITPAELPAPLAVAAPTAAPLMSASRPGVDWQRWKRPAAFAALAVGIALMVALYEGAPWMGFAPPNHVALQFEAASHDAKPAAAPGDNWRESNSDMMLVPAAPADRDNGHAASPLSKTGAAAIPAQADLADRSLLGRNDKAEMHSYAGVAVEGTLRVADEDGAVLAIKRGQQAAQDRLARGLQRQPAAQSGKFQEQLAADVTVVTSTVSSDVVERLLVSNGIELQIVGSASELRREFDGQRHSQQQADAPAAHAGDMLYYVVAPEEQLRVVVGQLRGAAPELTNEVVLPAEPDVAQQLVAAYRKAADTTRVQSSLERGAAPAARPAAGPQQRAAGDTAPDAAPSRQLRQAAADRQVNQNASDASIDTLARESRAEVIGTGGEVSSRVGQAQRWLVLSADDVPVDTRSLMFGAAGSNRMPVTGPPLAPESDRVAEEEKLAASSAAQTATPPGTVPVEPQLITQSEVGNTSELAAPGRLAEVGRLLQESAQQQNQRFTDPAMRRRAREGYSQALILVPAIVSGAPAAEASDSAGDRPAAAAETAPSPAAPAPAMPPDPDP